MAILDRTEANSVLIISAIKTCHFTDPTRKIPLKCIPPARNVWRSPCCWQLYCARERIVSKWDSENCVHGWKNLYLLVDPPPGNFVLHKCYCKRLIFFFTPGRTYQKCELKLQMCLAITINQCGTAITNKF